MNSSVPIRIAGVLGFLGVALGAFGAHELKAQLAQNGTTGNWETAVLYHLVHAAALLAVALWGGASKWVTHFFAAGIVIFSGTLYVLALTKLKWLGAITPIGGLCFLVGWAWLIFRPYAGTGRRQP